MEEHFGVNNVWIVQSFSVNDGINAARLVFDKMLFDQDNTEQLRQALSNYTQERDDKKGMFNDNPLHNWASHAADMFRYAGITIKALFDAQTVKTAVIAGENEWGDTSFAARPIEKKFKVDYKDWVDNEEEYDPNFYVSWE